MNILIYDKENLNPLLVSSYSHEEDIPADYQYMEIAQEDMEYRLEVYRHRGKIKYRRKEKIYPPEKVKISKSSFRKRLTLEEKLWWDHFEEDESLAGTEKQMVRTMMKDFDIEETVDLQDSSVRQRLEYFAGIGKIAKKRVEALLKIEG